MPVGATEKAAAVWAADHTARAWAEDFTAKAAAAGIRTISQIVIFPLLVPNPDKPDRMATKAQRHKQKLFIII